MFSFLPANSFYSLLSVVVILLLIYQIYQKKDIILHYILDTFEYLSGIVGSKLKSDKKIPAHEYMDFSKMEFENNEKDPFDSDLIDQKIDI